MPKVFWEVEKIYFDKTKNEQTKPASAFLKDLFSEICTEMQHGERKIALFSVNWKIRYLHRTQRI